MNVYTPKSNLESITPEPLFLFTLKGRLLTGGGILILALILISIFFYDVYARVVPYKAHEVTAVGGLPAALVATSTVPLMREVHIANDGLILVRGARVIASSGNTINISIIWGGVDFRWIVQVADNTTFLTSGGEKATQVDIKPGDILNVVGMLTGGGAEPMIKASFVRG